MSYFIYKNLLFQADLCTHIVYGFAVLDPNSLTIRAHDSWADFDNAFYQQVTAFKSANKKVLLALGGWNDSKGDKYSKVRLSLQTQSLNQPAAGQLGR